MIAIGSIVLTAVLITISMLVTRIVALFYVKQELYKYFYTEMHIQVGYILATMTLYLTYINFR